MQTDHIPLGVNYKRNTTVIANREFISIDLPTGCDNTGGFNGAVFTAKGSSVVCNTDS
jgi:hypothetical protein